MYMKLYDTGAAERSMYEKDYRKEFEELVAKDEALAAKAKEITGEGEALKKEIIAFAESLGYELDLGEDLKELELEEMDSVTGGCEILPPPRCDYNWVFVRREKGIFWGYNLVFKCSKCKVTKVEWD